MKLRCESGGSVEGSDPKGEVVFWDSGPDRIEIHPGRNLKERSEDSMLTPLAAEGFMQYAG